MPTNDYKPDIWLQQPDEPSDEFEWFSAYLSLEQPRNILQAYKNYVADHPTLRFNAKIVQLPREWHMLSLGLTMHEEATPYGTWVARASAYDAWLEEAKQFEEKTKKLTARDTRRKFMGRMEEFLTTVMDTADENNPASVRAATHAMSTFLDQSRQEHNDLPVTRKDLTTGNEKLKSVTIVWERPKPSDSILEEGEKDGTTEPDSSNNSS